MKEQLTQSRLKELLHYDPETGIFTRRVACSFRAPVGAVAGWVTGHGYRSVSIDYKPHLMHRLAFLYMTGEWPPEDVDHINGNRTDNRWANLRHASRSENNQNIAGPKSHNRSTGLLGAWPSRNGGFFSRIRVNGKITKLGHFPTPEAAHAAYLKAKDELHPTHRRLRSEA